MKNSYAKKKSIGVLIVAYNTNAYYKIVHYCHLLKVSVG